MGAGLGAFKAGGRVDAVIHTDDEDIQLVLTAGDGRDTRTRGGHSSVEGPPAGPPSVNPGSHTSRAAVREPRFPRRSLYNAVHGGGKDIELIGTARDCVNWPRLEYGRWATSRTTSL